MAYYFGDALTEIKKIKGKPDGNLDFGTMPKFAVAKDGGRDLGAMISMLIVAIQQLLERVEKLEMMN